METIKEVETQGVEPPHHSITRSAGQEQFQLLQINDWDTEEGRAELYRVDHDEDMAA